MNIPSHIDSYFQDAHPAILDEMTYQDIFKHINPNDLPHRDYAPLIPFVKYIGTKQDIMKFFVPNRYDGFNTYIQFIEWQTELTDQRVTPTESARLLLWSGNLRMHCGCPSFKYYGYQYILTQLGASISAEDRFPHIRNPQLKGVACKHLRRTLKVLPFHLGDMAKAIKEQRSG